MTAKFQSGASQIPDSTPQSSLPQIEFGREICCSLANAEQREWLVTNRIGGYASGTVAGLATRRYHGLLIAALKPPLGRTLLVAKMEETVEYGGAKHALSANRWADGAVSPQGYVFVERFRLEGTTPVWTFAHADERLEKRVWMQAGANTTFVQYALISSSGPLELELKVFVNYRDYHAVTHAGDWQMQVERTEHGLRIVAFEGATPFYLSALTGAAPAHVWYRNFDLSLERYRGLEDREDHLHAGTFHASLREGESITIAFSTESNAELDGTKAYQQHLARQQDLLDRWNTAHPEGEKVAPLWAKQLVAGELLFQPTFLTILHPATIPQCGHLVVLFIHLIATLARLVGPEGVRSLVADSLLLKHQLLIVNRSRQRPPNPQNHEVFAG